MYSLEPSYWEKTTFLSDIDIAIVGAGLVGTSAALYLKKKYPSAKIVVFDRGFIGSGASTKNAGFACFGSISEILEDLKSTSHNETFELVARRYEGMRHLLELCGEKNIDFAKKSGYEVFTSTDQTFTQECIHQIDFFNQEVKTITGLESTYQLQNDKIESNQLNGIQSCIVNLAEGQLHPGKMMQRLYALAREEGVLFYNGIEISSVEDHSDGVQMALSNGWLIKSSKLLLANNGFAQRLIPNLEIEAVRNQVILTSEIPDLKLSGAFHMHKGYIYFRDVGSRVLIGGARHLDRKGETTDSFGYNTLIEEALIQLLEEVILNNKDYTIEHKWSGILGVGPKKLPILKKYSKHIYLAVRLGGMGVALGSILGRDAAKIM